MCEEMHCACFETLCLHPDYASSHIDKILVNKHAHSILSSSILCVMTSTGNIIDAVVMCTYMTICQQVNPPKQNVYRSAPAKAAKYIAVSIHWGKYCGHC